MAYVMLTIKLGMDEGGLLKELRDVEYVKEAYRVLGIYDIVLKMESESLDDLKKTIVYKLRRLPQVSVSLTMPVVESYGKHPQS